MKALHPVAKSPMIEDDGRIIIESGAIAEHIIERYGNGRLAPAPGTQAHERYRQWLYFAVSSGMNPIMIKVYARAFGLGGTRTNKPPIGQLPKALPILANFFRARPFWVVESFWPRNTRWISTPENRKTRCRSGGFANTLGGPRDMQGGRGFGAA